MEYFMQAFEASNAFFASGLSKLNIGPQYYATMFPPAVTLDYVLQLVDEKVMFTLPDLAPAFTYAIILSIIRFLLQNYLIRPFACWAMQIREYPFVAIGDIDRALPFKPKQSNDPADVKAYAESSGRKAIDVRKYLWERKRSKMTKTRIVKFVEAFWRFCFYSGFCILGYNALFVPEPASWLLNTRDHFEGWPHHTISQAMFFYYHIELGCYIHQLLWTEVSRSDSVEMIVHHIVTISLIVLSFLTKFMRIGAVILLIHDLADVFLESAKVFNYMARAENTRWMKDYIVDPLFGVFAVTFFITRLVIYPRNILFSLRDDGYVLYGCDWGGCPAYIGLLFTLQFLHIYWFYLIMVMVVKLAMGTMKDDERSDNEDELEDDPTKAVEDKEVKESKKKK